MPGKKEWTILGSVYKTAKSVDDRVKAIKKRLSFGVQITKGDEDFEFMLDLYKKYYPRKASRKVKESEIMDLTVLMNAESRFSNSSPTFFWIDIHGCLGNWNPWECTHKKPSDWNNITKAFRLAIQPQVDAARKRFRESIKDELPLCPITGKPFDPRRRGEANAHHLPPEFKDILDGFAQTTGIDIRSLEVRVSPNDGYELVDQSIAIMFAEYHEIHAKFQIVSKAGHDLVTYKRESSDQEVPV